MKTILVFGGSGFVGGNISHLANKLGHRIFISDKIQKEKLKNFEFIQCEITNISSIKACIQKAKPDLVINTAAIADIDFAERENEITHKVNTQGALTIAELCAAYNMRHVFISSDAVYSGEKMEYFETDETSPINYYGFTKSMAEKKIGEVNPKSVIVRISLVLGFPLDGGNSFLADINKKLICGSDIESPTDIIRTPIDVKTLSAAVLELGLSDFYGIIHLGSFDKISRYELTKLLAHELGFDKQRIKPFDSISTENPKAKRHKNGSLNVTKAIELLQTKMLSIEVTIKNAVERIEL
jgi:dTDP-4-dehydrorhamnose reductase